MNSYTYQYSESYSANLLTSEEMRKDEKDIVRDQKKT